jgi:uncharacterized protein YceK
MSEAQRRLPLMAMLLLTAQLGCASVAVRTGGYSERTAVYPATAVNLAVIAFVATEPFGSWNDSFFPPDAQQGLVYLFLPVSIVDLPIAVALDTLLLPFDLYELRNRTSKPDTSKLKDTGG